MSGHIFVQVRGFVCDDGLCASARLLEILSQHDLPSAVLEALPKDVSTPEIKLEMQEGQPHVVIARLQIEGQVPSATSLSTIVGVRAGHDDGFSVSPASTNPSVIFIRHGAV